MIDLHIHSSFSDGRYDVDTILKKAQETGCTIISIVDHNTCDAYEYLRKIKNTPFKGKIISGCEFNTYYKDFPIEILGYDYDPNLLKSQLKEMYRYSKEEIDELTKKIFINKCKENGIKLALDEFEQRDKEHLSTFFFKCLTHYEENKQYFQTQEDFNNPNVFYRKYMSDSSSVFFCDLKEYYPTLEKVIEAIKSAGGKVFIPHIFEYKDNARKILTGLLSTGKIDGLECFYSKYTPEQMEKLNKFAEENGLLKSGGSDCHGGSHILIGVGRGNLNTSPEMIGTWINQAKDFNYGRDRDER